MKKQWWHDKICYQIYPKSFYDSNGDGIGDIQGIITKLDYLKDLGIDIIWISPMYKSPFADQGYDVADYYSIDPIFGNLDDLESLLQETKKRSMYLLMDLVINHCSDEHQWFVNATQDLTSKYANYFYIEKGENGNPPTNLRSYFGGSAWENIKGTDQYYLHMYAKKQPDLNWENPEVVKELYEMVNWWLEKGLAGFRIDAIVNIKKDLPFKNYMPDRTDGLSSPEEMVRNANGVLEMLHDLKANTFDKYNAIAIAEMFEYDNDNLGLYIGDKGCFSTIFDFDTSLIGSSEKGWYARTKPTMNEYKNVFFQNQLAAQGIGFMCNIIENHDQPRGVSRYLPTADLHDKSKKLLATIFMMARGLPFIYQGQEIGMENTVYQSILQVDDVYTIGEYNTALEAGLDEQTALKNVCDYCRDHTRTPMQWTANKHGGFTTGTPWLSVNDNYKWINVENQLDNNDSIFSFYKKLITLRKGTLKSVLVDGEFIPVYEQENNVIAFIRQKNKEKALIIANSQNNHVILPFKYTTYDILLSNDNMKIHDEKLYLTGYTSVIFKIN
ncbi:MAG: alpha-glucosidase [Eubacteriales bacterium]